MKTTDISQKEKNYVDNANVRTDQGTIVWKELLESIPESFTTGAI